MESPRSSRHERDSHRRYRSRSRPSSHDSEEERRRRRRRKERERKAGDRYSDEPSDTRHGRHGDSKGKYGDGDRTRRTSRSPAEQSSQRRRDRFPRDQTRRGRKDMKSPRDDSAAQLSRKSKGPLPSQAASFQHNNDPSKDVTLVGDKEVPEKQKPNFAPTGLLAAASNSIAQADGTSITLKYHEPPEARKPPAKDEWKLFVFKGSDILETIELSTRSCWLVGREMAVVDMAAEHPSISKQHAVIQFRYIEKTNGFGDKLGKVKPYLIDLESANGTSLNKEDVPPTRYLELRDKDMIQFGHSTREYVLMLSPKV